MQYHFHTPSEHAVNGALADGELHLVHKAADGSGDLAVVGVLLDADVSATPNAAWNQLLNDPPPTASPEKVIAGPHNADDLLPANRQYYRYSGSLTTPPASEIVAWHVIAEPVKLPPAMILAIRGAIGEDNNRPVQLVNDRTVLLDVT